VGVVELQPWLLTAVDRRRAQLALGVLAVAEADPLADEAARGWPVQTVVVVEVGVMRVIGSRRVRREMHQVVM
jgi:hypothetical protein